MKRSQKYSNSSALDLEKKYRPLSGQHNVDNIITSNYQPKRRNSNFNICDKNLPTKNACKQKKTFVNQPILEELSWGDEGGYCGTKNSPPENDTCEQKRSFVKESLSWGETDPFFLWLQSEKKLQHDTEILSRAHTENGFTSIPEVKTAESSSPSLPESSSPLLPESSPLLPESSPLLPESFPLLPESSPLLPESSSPSISEVKTAESSSNGNLFSMENAIPGCVNWNYINSLISFICGSAINESSI